MTSSLQSPRFLVEVIGVWTVRKGTTRQENSAARTYVNAVKKIDREQLRKHRSENVDSAIERLLLMTATPATADQRKRENLFVKGSTRALRVSRSCRARKQDLKITYAVKKCFKREEYVVPNTHRCYMNPIETCNDSRENRKKTTNIQKTKCVLNELLDESVVKENDNDDNDPEEEKEGKKYVFYIEARQGDGRHVANPLIAQDEAKFERVFKGENCVEKFREWLLDGTHQEAIVMAYNCHSIRFLFPVGVFLQRVPSS